MLDNPQVITVIPARNEEKFLSLTLSRLLDQSICPKKVVVVNDGSEDKTREVALGYDKVEVVDIVDRGYAVQGTPVLAHVINQGLEKIKTDSEVKYIMILGADHLLPPDYLATVNNTMGMDNNIAICSGQIYGERSVVPRGSGRVVRADFWKGIGLHYPANYGFETYLLIKAQLLGYKVKVLNDLITTTQRPTGKNYKKSVYVSYGKSLKALGYSKLYSIARIGLLSLRNPKGAAYMARGYMSNDVQIYDNDLRVYLSSIQHKKIKKYVTNPARALLGGEAA